MTQQHRHRRNCNKPGHAHGLTFSCYQRFRFLQAERTCRWLAEAIEEARADLNFSLWAYVFMPEHVHLIAWPREPVYDIADVRKAIKSSVGRIKRSAAPADASGQTGCRNGVGALLGPAYGAGRVRPGI